LLRHATFRQPLGAAIIGLLALLSGCGSAVPAPSAADQDTSNVVVAAPAPTPAPTPAPVPAPAASLSGEAVIADNFSTGSGLVAATMPAESADPAGAFRMFCTPGQLLKDDPIVYPGQPGASHLHQFFGNTGTNASSNYQSLRTSGGTTCGNSATPLNRSAYWFPAMLDGAGHVVKPDFLNVYYKRYPASDPACSLSSPAHLGQCIDLPNGLRYITGYNMKTMSGGPADINSWDYFAIYFQCWSAGTIGEDGTPLFDNKKFQTIAAVVAAGCPVGAQLVIIGINPNCWDGVNLDSADHRSHMSYQTGEVVASLGQRACPADHPYLIPGLQVHYHFTVDENFVAGKWHLASDEMMPGVAAGTTFHMDYWEAWSPSVKATWHQYCINGHLSCAEGQLGNGMEIAGAQVPSGGWPRHQLAAVP
jgi:hypothetical protein